MSDHGMCEFVVQITADQFLSLRNTLVQENEKLKEKQEHLLKTYPCFTTPTAPNPHPSYNPKHKRNRHEFKGNRTEKVKIGCRDLSRENFGRKDFMALMNKMTNANKDTILQSIRNAYRDDCQNIYTEITWSMMQKSPEFHDLHWQVITAIRDVTSRKEEWQNSWKDIADVFLSEEKWVPTQTIIESEDYDEFCDFVKWRKSVIASIRALCMLEDRRWIGTDFRMSLSDAIRTLLQSRLEEPNCIGDKLTDALIEQLHTIVSITNDRRLVQYTCDWFEKYAPTDVLTRLRPASRFKMYDLHELVDRKMKTT